jgi:hypothetical protein
MSATLIVFTRLPEPGRTKTRLAGALGDEGAAELHREMAERTLAVACKSAAVAGARLEIHHTGDAEAMRRWLGDDLYYRPQVAGDLGRRMAVALAAGAPAVLVGTDCPDLTPAILAGAFAALADHDLVLGPAFDGGYYLIGLREPRPELFAGIAWGTDRVLAGTLAIAGDLGLTVAQLEPLADIDRPEDLDRLRTLERG